MIRKRVHKSSLNFDKDFFNEIKNDEDETDFTESFYTKKHQSDSKKYRIKSSLFVDSSEISCNLYSKRLSQMEISTSISDIKSNDYSFISKIDNLNKSEINKTKSDIKIEKNSQKEFEIECERKDETCTNFENSNNNILCMCSKSSCLIF